MMNYSNSIRPSPIAGTWYSADPEQLKKTVDEYLHAADPPELPGEVIALVAPHAGYRYSGPVAGYAFKTVQGKKFNSVAVISPMHQYHPRPVLTSAHNAYQTPLGEIYLDFGKLSQIDTELQDKTGIALSAVANDQEHSLEIELPFLQRSLAGEFRLIPIMLRDQSHTIAKALGEALAKALEGSSFLMIASSDLSHFYNESQANQLDQAILQQIAEFSPEGLYDLKSQGKGHACGLAAIAAVMWASKLLGADTATLLNYATSAAVTGDTSSVVGYGAAAITRPA